MAEGKVFFSYSRTDTDFVHKLARDLASHAVDVWIDQISIGPGKPWDKEIENVIQASECMIVVLSPASVSSNNVLDEVSFALNNGKKIIPVLISPCSIPLRLTRLQYTDFTRDYSNALNKVLSELNKPVTPPSPPSSPMRWNRTVLIAVSLVIIAVFAITLYISNRNANQRQRDALVGQADKLASRNQDLNQIEKLDLTDNAANAPDITNGSMIFYDNFSSNSNNWQTGTQDVLSRNFENGVYSLENTKPYSFGDSPQKISISSGKNFLIEVLARQTKGTGYFYGLYWQSDWNTDLKISHYFTISSDYKSYEYYRDEGYKKNGINYANGTEVFSRLSSDKIKPGDGWNKLTAIRNGNVIQFYINNHLVNQAPYSGFDISSIGVKISGMIKAEFKEFRVKAD